MAPIALTTRNAKERLMKKTTIDPEKGCWLFMGHRDKDGYGRVRFNYRHEYVHRISAILFLNYDPEDKSVQVNHKTQCNTPNCWNPEHLYIGTQADNLADALILGTRNPNRIRIDNITRVKWS